jgi:GT2 family glycosyltransferase
MNNPRVAIIILNWNGWKDTIECLESIYQINYQNYSVVVVDNNSSDESIKKIKDYNNGKLKVESNFIEYSSADKPIEFNEFNGTDLNIEQNLSSIKRLFLIKNKINQGFAEGNNIGIRFALENINPSYILLLNNDTVVDKNFLTALIQEGEKNDKIGLLGPKIYYYDNPNVLWCIGGKIDWKFARGLHVGTNEDDHEQYENEMNFDYISGSALLIKTEVLKDVGLLDKRFFLYFEETDLALRASLKGYENLYVPNAMIWHKVSKSGGGIKNEIGIYYITRNRWLFMKKWANKGDFSIFVCLQIFMALVVPIFLTVRYNNKKLFRAYYRGLWGGINEMID